MHVWMWGGEGREEKKKKGKVEVANEIAEIESRQEKVKTKRQL